MELLWICFLREISIVPYGYHLWSKALLSFPPVVSCFQLFLLIWTFLYRYVTSVLTPVGCGGGTRTHDFQVMSLASWPLDDSAQYIKLGRVVDKWSTSCFGFHYGQVLWSHRVERERPYPTPSCNLTPPNHLPDSITTDLCCVYLLVRQPALLT